MAKALILLPTVASVEPPGEKFKIFDRSLSKHRTVKDNLLKAIKDSNSDALCSALTAPFIYQNEKEGVSHTISGNNPERPSFLTRPAIEALFFYYPSDFQEILMQLQDSNLAGTFITTCEKNSDIPRSLLTSLNFWEASIIQAEIEQLKTYGPEAKNIATQLENCMKGWNLHDPIETALFKLKFLTILHAHDNTLSRQSSHTSFNFYVLSFFGFIPNAIYWMVTGNSLFSQQSPEQRSIEKIDQKLGLFNIKTEQAPGYTSFNENSFENLPGFRT